MRRTNIYLADEQLEKLDRRASREGRTRAAVIRALLDAALADDQGDLEADLAALRDSFGAMGDVEWAPRGQDDRARHLDSIGR